MSNTCQICVKYVSALHNHKNDRAISRKNPNKDVATMDFKENTLAIPSRVQFSGDFDHLDEMVNSMMETSRERGKSCKVCGREGQSIDIKRHIEAHHLKGVSIPCNLCEKTFRCTKSLAQHKQYSHKQNFQVNA